MAHFNFSIDSLQDSASIANAVYENIVPKNGINITGTSAAERGYTGQTLTTSDLVSSASGKDLLASGIYSSTYRLSTTRESLQSLSSSILGGDDISLKVLDPTNLDEDGNPIVLTGQAAALRLIAGSSLGRQYNQDLIVGLQDLMNNKYGQTDNGAGHSADTQTGKSGVTSAGSKAIAITSDLTDVEKKAYISRGEILKSVMDISDSSTLQNGFDFDINNNLINLKYNTSTIFPGLKSSGNIIPADLISAGPQKAYISAALIECLIFLASDTNGSVLFISGGFGSSFRGDDDSVQGTNFTPLGNGDMVTDHVFGRAFDISKVSIKGEAAGNINSRRRRV